ncbi:MAG TPA: hydrogenobyrinic acid a,c-diamide synthase (glutamine-hydrolyzing) [Prosthecochloris aestuarii]|uniref:Hydrogenobyrinic acid a,c-diamide synthase (Glutamine-hydrolyzing) n=1 Tax=Prosthecochloris aestuarii TaxID=1102 RepID=A0A831SUC2_PROAE|nr:hydrogenobyrinic acid a,c-diamide synthase (glutamine-hydrolyzing) [Prosthecochloris aestuarii]
MVSAPAKSSGKTMVSLGILRYLSSRGIAIRSFKKGPDYIDPMWHRLASGSGCASLDPWMMGERSCLETFFRYGHGASCSLIEGNHGLHDGLDIEGTDSSAGLASLLGSPVLLVLDSSRLNRGAAAQVLGMQQMPPRPTIAGVILNKVRGMRQAEKQRAAIERFCHVPVLGAIPADEELVIPERHLGLTTVGESAGAEECILRAQSAVSRYCDMEAITQLFHSAPPMDLPDLQSFSPYKDKRTRIGVFRDPAFCFYYPDNLEALERNGAELVFIDTFAASGLPDLGGLYIGGGFPESFLDRLSANTGLLGDVRSRVESGMPLYAECGGLIYLSRTVSWQAKSYALAGLLPYDIEFSDRPAGHGYLDLQSMADSPWFARGECVRAHEFHYGSPVGDVMHGEFQFRVVRGHGVTGAADGFVCKNLFASFAHLHVSAFPAWAERFVDLAEGFLPSSGDHSLPGTKKRKKIGCTI